MFFSFWIYFQTFSNFKPKKKKHKNIQIIKNDIVESHLKMKYYSNKSATRLFLRVP